MVLIFQANVGKITEALHGVLETAKEKGADLVMIEEPSIGRGEFAPRHTAFEIIWPQTTTGRPSRVATVRFFQSFIELYGQYKSTTDCSSWRELNFGLSLTSNFTKGNLLYKRD